LRPDSTYQALSQPQGRRFSATKRALNIDFVPRTVTAYDDNRTCLLASNVSKPAELTYRIRDYRAADFDQLWRIDQLCFAPGIAYTQMELNGFIMRRNAITLVAELDEAAAGSANAVERIAGYVLAHPIRRKYARIITLDILPDARRLGLATNLMNAAEERLRSLGCSEVYLETAVNNEPGIRLYRKLGYEILKTIPEYYSSHSLDAYQMGKRL
jgi:ribosomal-protein-alanine N-acetyltransferase